MNNEYENMQNNFLARLDELKKRFGKPFTVKLTIYQNDEALKFFRPNETWNGGAAEHAKIMYKLALEAQKQYGVQVELVEIDTQKYLSWLAEDGLSDSPANRAAYISAQTS